MDGTSAIFDADISFGSASVGSPRTFQITFSLSGNYMTIPTNAVVWSNENGVTCSTVSFSNDV